MNPIHLAISTCPNDTFAFHAILENKIDCRGIDFHVELLDIQQLNQGLMEHRFDVAKASFHAALHLAPTMAVLPSGSALGFGVGPLLLASEAEKSPHHRIGNRPGLTLCPGELTTATLLFRLFYNKAIEEGAVRVEQTLFSKIMPKLVNGEADFGVCIHEGRFTWQDENLSLIEDLGTRWESETQSPLPLGGILVRKSLPSRRIDDIQTVIRASIEYGLAHRDETLPTMRRYAQSLDDNVLMQHVELYVNRWTIDLGETGRRALQTLASKATEVGLFPNDSPPLTIWE